MIDYKYLFKIDAYEVNCSFEIQSFRFYSEA